MFRLLKAFFVFSLKMAFTSRKVAANYLKLQSCVRLYFLLLYVWDCNAKGMPCLKKTTFLAHSLSQPL